jgi:hypothetical protein
VTSYTSRDSDKKRNDITQDKHLLPFVGIWWATSTLYLIKIELAIIWAMAKGNDEDEIYTVDEPLYLFT